MKRVLITGKNSYVGTYVEKWLMREPDKYYVETISLKDPNWKEFDFSKFDVVFHVAGIAHVSTKKKMKDLYFKVNRDLAIETAIKAKEAGIKQFIFMSSMIVYNSRETKITLETVPNPDNFYGLSKLHAEQELLNLKSDIFNICILRPPMIYGSESKGNFAKLIHLAKIMPFFPKIYNKRSVLYISNLCKYVTLYIDKQSEGIYYPQNKDYFSTMEAIKILRSRLHKKTIFLTILNLFVKITIKRLNIVNKLFGDFYYDFYDQKLLNLITFEDSLIETLR